MQSARSEWYIFSPGVAHFRLAMKLLRLFIETAILACTSAWAVGATATLEGKVTLPPVKSGPAMIARYQSKSSTPPGPPAPPAAVVYLEGTALAPNNSGGSPVAEMGQKNLQFIPGVIAVQKGTRVTFPNYDDEYHNVLSYSKAKELDLGRYRSTETPPAVVFDKAGPVELSCEIHQHMHATILVVDTPYFATTDAEGKYRITHVPPGKYTAKVWFNGKTVWQQPVEFTEGENKYLDFSK